MDNLARAALAGIAIGGFTAAVVEANRITLRALVRLNGLALETACVMIGAVWEKMGSQQQDSNQAPREDEV